MYVMFYKNNQIIINFLIITIITVLINTSTQKYINNKTKNYKNVKITKIRHFIDKIREGFSQNNIGIPNQIYQNRIYYDIRAHIDKKSLSHHECNEIVNFAKQYSFEKYEEPVDGKPVYQLDILTDGKKINYPKLWKKIKPIYENQVKEILDKTTWALNYKLDFVFLKRYLPTERKYLGLHKDSNFFTVTYLLTDTSKYEGGNFFMYTQKNTTTLEHKIDNYSPKEKDKFVNNQNNLSVLPIIVNYQIGDAMVFSGEDHFHGILPVTSGERYVLIFFFDNNLS